MSYEHPHCEYCRDTGRTIVDLATGEHSDYLDCGHCSAAQERTALEGWAKNLADINRLPLADSSLMWAIHERARDQAYAEIVRLSKERNQAEARIVSSTDAFKRIAQAHHAALVATNGDAGEIAKLAAYLGLAPHVDAQAARIAELEAENANLRYELKASLSGEVINLTKADTEMLVGLIDNPPAPNEALIKAFERHQEIITPLPADTDKLREAQANPQAMTYPAEIWLQVGGDCDADECTPFSEARQSGEITWCEDCIDSMDVHYVRADLAAAPALQAPVREVPEGWKLTRCEDGTIIVSKNNIGGYAAWKDDSNIASSILYHFADEFLATVPAAPAPQEGDHD